MKFRDARLALVVVCVLSGTAALAQQKLGDLVAQGGFEWMIGAWTASTDDGQQIQFSYKWDLDRHVVMMHFKMGDYEARNMIFYVAGEDKIVQIGADNRGGTSKSVWEPSGDKAVCKMEGKSAEGEVNKMGLAHSRIDAETMRIEVYAIEANGELADYAWATLECKRKTEPAPKQ